MISLIAVVCSLAPVALLIGGGLELRRGTLHLAHGRADLLGQRRGDEPAMATTTARPPMLPHRMIPIVHCAGGPRLGGATGQQFRLLLIDLRHRGPDLIHEDLAAIVLDHRQRRVENRYCA
ncbi:MAG: hypothetical protein WDN69_29520 [Aliidongia sp.]